MKRRILYCFILWLGLVANARAAGEWFELNGFNGWSTSNLDHAAAKGLKLFAGKKEELHSVTFTSSGDWVILFGGNGVWTSNLDLPATKKLVELQKGNTLKCVAFAPNGGWTVFWNQNGNWSQNIPDDAFKKIVEVAKSGGTLRSIAFGPGGGWVLLFDETGVWHGGIPDDLAKVLNNAVQNRNPVRCVSFTTRGDWFCLADKGWWTSNLDHPASKQLARLSKEGKKLKWAAVAPELGEHDFEKWARIIHRECDGKHPGGYAFEVLHKGKVVAKGAEGWARAPWEKDHPSVKWTLDKPMGVASVSKTITAVSLLKLWEETGQKFSLDGAFWHHIKAICPDAHADVKQVTIRQLLQHKSGFKKTDGYESPQELEKLLTQPLAHKPGTHSEYDNNNFYIARLVLEQIGHVQYTPYVKKHVLQPMGITHMETHFQAQQPTCGYGKPGSTRPGFPFDWNCDATAGAAGWYASITDIGLFLIGLRDHKVLSAATTDMMYKDLLGWDTNHPGWEKNGGWFWDEGTASGSRAGAFRSSIYHFPDDVDAVMFINSDTAKAPEEILGQAWSESMQK